MKNTVSFSSSRRITDVPERLFGFPYLLLIALLTGIIGGAFQLNRGALLMPAGFIALLLLLGIATNKLMSMRTQLQEETL